MSRLCMPIGSPVPPGRIDRNLLAAQGSYTATGQTATLTYSPASSSSTWPESEADARFAGNATATLGARLTASLVQNTTYSGYAGGDPVIGYDNYTVNNCCFLDCGEGPRIGGSNILIQDVYIKCHGQGADHGDGCQGYAPGDNPTNVVLRRVKIDMRPGANNCGFFLADNIGASVTLENVKIVGGADCPNGAIWMPNRPGDTGVRSLSFTNCDFDYVNRGIAGIDYSGSGAVQPTIVAWSNVRVAGVLVPRPY